jgi:hypothetical protein
MPEQPITIRGKVVNTEGASLRVEAYHRESGKLLGSARTDPEGRFQIAQTLDVADVEFRVVPETQPCCGGETSDEQTVEVELVLHHKTTETPTFKPLQINTYADLLAHEDEILGRIERFPNGGNLFMIHPFMLFEEIGVEISAEAKREIEKKEPHLRGLSPTPYRALRKNGAARQNVRFHIKGLFRRRK